VQANLKLQEESAKWWTGFLAQSGWPQDWQKRMSSVAAESLPVLQKRMEESVRLLELTGRTSLDLWKQALESLKPEAVGAGQNKLQELWEASLQAMRNNAQAIAQTNAKIIDYWMQAMPKPKETTAAARGKAA
jgi:hypothetical protein